MKTLLLLLALGQSHPVPSATITAKQGLSPDGGVSWVVECTNCGGVTPNVVYVADAGVLNINLPAVYAVQLPDAGSVAADTTVASGFSPTGVNELTLIRRTAELQLLEQQQQTLLLQKIAGAYPGANP